LGAAPEEGGINVENETLGLAKLEAALPMHANHLTKGNCSWPTTHSLRIGVIKEP
jgi:hypothetical protein